MSTKPALINKIVCSLLLAVIFLFVSCKESGDNDGYNNPNAGVSRVLTFSHNSGLYNQQFSLRITAPPESVIYYSTDGSIPLPEKVGNGFVFRYSSPITVRNRNGQPNVLATPENSRQFYMYPYSDPNMGGIIGGIGDRAWAQPEYIPSNEQVPKATVIRAIAVDSSGRQSDVLTRTYFIGDNLANYANNRILSLVTDPYNLVDQDYGIMVRGRPGQMWDTNPPYNFRQRGIDWERETYMEIFEGNTNSRSVTFSDHVGLRIRGGWSRGHGQKNFNIYFRDDYGGINNFRRDRHGFELIPGAVKADGKTPVDITKSFMLRSGGNQDSEYTKFYDVFLHDLLSDRSFTTQATVPCIIYLNGEYWGPYNFSERFSDNHTEYKYGVDRNNVISVESGALDDGNPGEIQLFRQMMDMRNNDMSIKANYDAFCAVFDIQNFIDYFTSHIYFYNEDWPQWNYRAWRTRTVEPGNPYGDTRWRWQMHDTEMSMGIYSGGGLTGGGQDAFAKILNGEHRNMLTNHLFRALLANPDFCRQFVNTMLDIYNVNFHPDSFGPKLDNYVAVYEALMAGYHSRWGYPGGWTTVFQTKANDARRYLTDIRGVMVNNYLPTYFGGYSGIANIGISAGNLRNVTLSTTGASGASIKINTTTPNLVSGSWTGRYYSGNPITVTASVPPGGYEFDGWTVTGGTAVSPSALTTTVNFTGNVQITAKYKLTGSTVIPVNNITLNRNTLELTNREPFNLSAAVGPSNATYRTVLWDSNNRNVVNVDNNGRVNAISVGTATITASTVEGISAACTVIVTSLGDIVLLDLAEKLKTLSPQVIDTWSKFNTAFRDIPVASVGGVGTDVFYEIIVENGIKKLQAHEFALWGAGFDIAGIEFNAGDIIEVKGTFKSGPVNRIVFISDFLNWRSLQNWSQDCSNGQDFQRTFTLTAEDAAAINANASNNNDTITVRLRSNGVEPWSGPNLSLYPNGIARYVIEQIKVYRY